jgi:hypothetical protein
MSLVLAPPPHPHPGLYRQSLYLPLRERRSEREESEIEIIRCTVTGERTGKQDTVFSKESIGIDSKESIRIDSKESIGIDSASLCSLAGWYDNPIPTRFLASKDFFLKFQHRFQRQQEVWSSFLTIIPWGPWGQQKLHLRKKSKDDRK